MISRIIKCCWLSVTVSTSAMELQHNYHCHSQFHGVAACLSLSLSVPWSCCMSVTVSNDCWLSPTVSTRAMELVYVSHCLLWLLDVFLQSHGVATCLSLLLAFSHCLSSCYGVATRLPLSLQVPWSCWMSLTVPRGCWQSLTVSSVTCSCCMSLTVPYGCWLLLTVSGPTELLNVSHCLV